MISPSKNPAYVLARQDVLSMVDESKPCTSLLDVGCSRGATAALFRASRPEISRAVGIELDQQAAQAAREASFDEVHCEDAEQVLSRLATQAERFDLILCGDVLEHLLDREALRRVLAHQSLDQLLRLRRHTRTAWARHGYGMGTAWVGHG